MGSSVAVRVGASGWAVRVVPSGWGLGKVAARRRGGQKRWGFKRRKSWGGSWGVRAQRGGPEGWRRVGLGAERWGGGGLKGGSQNVALFFSSPDPLFFFSSNSEVLRVIAVVSACFHH